MNNLFKFFASGNVDDGGVLVQEFKERVLADGGTFEAENYLRSWIRPNRDLYNRASFLLTPNGYKSGVLYAFKGTDFTGVTRASNGTRINASGTEDLIGLNIPRLDYEHATPTWLNEISTTNLWWNSSTQTIIVIVGRRYTLSFFGTGTVTVTGGLTGTAVGTSNTTKTFLQFANATATTTSVTLTVTGTVFAGNFVNSSITTVGGSIVNTINQPTSHIPTVASNVTRSADNYRLLTLNLFDTPYLCFFDFIFTASTLNTTDGSLFSIELNTSNYVTVRIDSNVILRNAGVFTTILGAGNTDTNRNYGVRNRVLFYHNPITGNATIVTAAFIGGAWNIIRTRSSTLSASQITSFTKLTINNDNIYGGTSTKNKTFAIIKDFSGISNIPAYMQNLATKTSL